MVWKNNCYYITNEIIALLTRELRESQFFRVSLLKINNDWHNMMYSQGPSEIYFIGVEVSLFIRAHLPVTDENTRTVR